MGKYHEVEYLKMSQPFLSMGIVNFVRSCKSSYAHLSYHFFERRTTVLLRQSIDPFIWRRITRNVNLFCTTPQGEDTKNSILTAAFFWQAFPKSFLQGSSSSYTEFFRVKPDWERKLRFSI